MKIESEFQNEVWQWKNEQLVNENLISKINCNIGIVRLIRSRYGVVDFRE